MGFATGGKCLPGDYVDEGKLLLFKKRTRKPPGPPQRVARLEAEKQRKREVSSAQKSKSSKRRKRPTDRLPADGPADGATAVDGSPIANCCPTLVLLSL